MPDSEGPRARFLPHNSNPGLPVSRINITLPVFNEATRLTSSVHKLTAFLRDHPELDCEILIADNGSNDATLLEARALERNLDRVKVMHLAQKGRGRALRHAWTRSEAQFLGYMDIDLSTDLGAFPPLVEALVSGGYDLAVGSRLLPESHVTRCWKREVISRCYNRLARSMLGTRLSDAQCGFKAITRSAAARLLPLIEDNGWFFDTELLVLAEKAGLRVFELPVGWIEDSDSRVKVLPTAWADLRGLMRLRRNLRRNAYADLPASLRTQAAQPGDIP